PAHAPHRAGQRGEAPAQRLRETHERTPGHASNLVVALFRTFVDCRAVEDRVTAGLYLEMTDAMTPDEYSVARADDVLTLDGVERATWWRNVNRDRRDLPRVLDEFDT